MLILLDFSLLLKKNRDVETKAILITLIKIFFSYTVFRKTINQQTWRSYHFTYMCKKIFTTHHISNKL